MMTSCFAVAFVLGLTAVVLADVVQTPLAEHMFNAGARASDWEIGGDAAFVGHALRLTPDRQSRAGFLFAKKPLATIGHEWVLDMEFRIYGQGVSLFGDGMALWMTKERFSPGKGDVAVPSFVSLQCL
jgi:Legume-like lectin family